MLIFKSIGLVKHRIPNSIECGDQDAELVDPKKPKPSVYKGAMEPRDASLVCTRRQRGGLKVQPQTFLC